MEFVLYIAILFQSLLTHCIVNDGRDFFWKVVYVLALFDLNMKQCASKNVVSRDTFRLHGHMHGPHLIEEVFSYEDSRKKLHEV